MIADLRTHSDSSDGRLVPGALPALAAMKDVDMMSITDHDRPAADARPGDGPKYGIELITDIELSTTSAGRDAHGPETAWSSPGRSAPLPGDIGKVRDRW